MSRENLLIEEPTVNDLVLIEAEENEKNNEILFSEEDSYATVDSVKQYFKEIANIKILTAKEECEIGWQIYAGIQAKEELQYLTSKDEIADCKKIIEEGETAEKRLVEANLRLVVSIAKTYSYEGMELLDVINEGNLGLMKAASKFDVSKGFRFSTYATWWIKQAILRSIMEKDNLIRLPVHKSELINKIKKTQRELFAVLGRDASSGEIATHLGVDTVKVEEAMQYSSSCKSLEAPVGEEEDAKLVDFIVDTNSVSPEALALEGEMRQIIKEWLNTLSKKETEILSYMFGFYGRTYTLEEVGTIYGITRERVRQIKEKAVRKLRMKTGYCNKLKGYYESLGA